MENHVGLKAQIRQNNLRSIILLFSFPLLFVAVCWVILWVTLSVFNFLFSETFHINQALFYITPYLFAIVMVWFTIAYFFHHNLIMKATGSQPIERMENKKIYNVIENLCIEQGIPMPSVYIMNDTTSFNAFATGINSKTFTISLSQGLISKLNDSELKAVAAYELSSIQSRNTRVLVISIVFVGIFRFIMESLCGKTLLDIDKKRPIRIILGLMALLIYCISLMLKALVIKSRVFLTDAAAVEITKDPISLISALKKIAENPMVNAVRRKDLAQLFILQPKGTEEIRVFSSNYKNEVNLHASLEKRIAYLEQV